MEDWFRSRLLLLCIISLGLTNLKHLTKSPCSFLMTAHNYLPQIYQKYLLTEVHVLTLWTEKLWHLPVFWACKMSISHGSMLIITSKSVTRSVYNKTEPKTETETTDMWCQSCFVTFYSNNGVLYTVSCWLTGCFICTGCYIAMRNRDILKWPLQLWKVGCVQRF